MYQRRTGDRNGSKWSNVVSQFRRFWLDILIILVIFGLSFLLPDTPEEAKVAGSQKNLLALFITKGLSVLFAWLLVDSGRKIKWPYLDLQRLVDGKDEDGNEIKNATMGIFFLSVIYAVVIYSFAVGG